MKLSALTQGVECTLVQGSMDTEITDIVYDSRKAAPGVLFVCIVGTQRDSHAFAATAPPGGRPRWSSSTTSAWKGWKGSRS